MLKFYQIKIGMHQHPQTFAERGLKPAKRSGYGPDDYQLLYPGDIVLVEEGLILRPPVMGGWADPQKNGVWAIECAVPVDADRESYVLRDEPSRIAGINISETQLRRVERQEQEGESAAFPRMSVSSDAPSSVKRVRQTA